LKLRWYNHYGTEKALRDVPIEPTHGFKCVVFDVKGYKTPSNLIGYGTLVFRLELNGFEPKFNSLHAIISAFVNKEGSKEFMAKSDIEVNWTNKAPSPLTGILNVAFLLGLQV